MLEYCHILHDPAPIHAWQNTYVWEPLAHSMLCAPPTLSTVTIGLSFVFTYPSEFMLDSDVEAACLPLILALLRALNWDVLD